MPDNKTKLPLLFDATRLLARARFTTPTGIDRVDLAYAQRLLESAEHPAALMAFDIFGPYRLDAPKARQLLTVTASRWTAAAQGESTVFRQISEWLTAPIGTPRPVLRASAVRVAVAREWPHRLSRAAERLPPRAARYINTSHGRLHRTAVSRWLRRSDSRGVFFVHDLIPIDYPQYNRPAEPARHAARLRTIAAHAGRVIVNSQTTQTSLLAWLSNERLPLPPVTVIPLGVADAFTPTARSGSTPATHPYFVVLGTLEPRKNHALLLRLWQRFATDRPGGAPRLVMLGRRGWENQALFDLMDSDSSLRPWVIETSGLADGEIAQLLRGACALLAPSFAEGFGLPLAEAMACGTPVLASDLPAHRETAGAFAEYLDPLDDRAWQRAIVDYATTQSPRRARRLAALADYQPLSWPEHTAQALDAILAP